jgi:Arc/MetJ-type ribon-helix-helix transcriptional regulator
MPTVHMPEGYKNVGVQEDLYAQAEAWVRKSKRYRSVSEFIHEAIRLRLERLEGEEERVEVATARRKSS